MKKENLNILITGTASGIGREVAKYFKEHNHYIYGLDINPSALDTVTKGYIADITNEEDLLKVKEDLVKNNVKFDMIMNFAGIHMMGSFLEGDSKKIERIMKINVFGAILVNKTFYPLLNEGGRITITSSEVASFDPLPFNGIYHVTKDALDCYSQVLRQELNLLGKKVITFRPGAVLTPLSTGSLDATIKLCEDTTLYKNESKHFLYLVKHFMGKPMPAHKFAAFVYKKSLKPHPKYIYKKHQSVGLILLNILPKRMQCAIIKLLLKRK